jgi:hypothetical protein
MPDPFSQNFEADLDTVRRVIHILLKHANIGFAITPNLDDPNKRNISLTALAVEVLKNEEMV